MTSEQDFKSRISIVQTAGKVDGRVVLTGSVRLVEEWHVDPTGKNAIEDGEAKLRELLWRRWQSMRKVEVNRPPPHEDDGRIRPQRD